MARQLEQAAASDDELQHIVTTELAPRTQRWRAGVGEVLEHLGASLDLAGLWAEADARAQAEQELRATTAEAQDAASSYTRHALRLAARALHAQRAELQEQARQVMLRSDLGASEKDSALRHLREDAAQSQRIILEKAKLIATSERASSMSVVQQQQLLTSLVTRAVAASRPSGEPSSANELEAQRRQLLASMSSGLGVHFATSLLDLSTEHDALAAQLAEASRGEAPEHAGPPSSLEKATDERSSKNEQWLSGLDRVTESLTGGAGVQRGSPPVVRRREANPDVMNQASRGVVRHPSRDAAEQAIRHDNPPTRGVAVDPGGGVSMAQGQEDV